VAVWPYEGRLCGGLFCDGGGVALAGAEVLTCVCDDVVGAGFCAVVLVLAARNSPSTQACEPFLKAAAYSLKLVPVWTRCHSVRLHIRERVQRRLQANRCHSSEALPEAARKQDLEAA
jgi:ABC-type uncharacterized transport system permease subunit